MSILWACQLFSISSAYLSSAQQIRSAPSNIASPAAAQDSLVEMLTWTLHLSSPCVPIFRMWGLTIIPGQAARARGTFDILICSYVVKLPTPVLALIWQSLIWAEPWDIRAKENTRREKLASAQTWSCGFKLIHNSISKNKGKGSGIAIPQLSLLFLLGT